MASAAGGGSGTVIVARGAGAVEALVLAEIGAHVEAARRDWVLLARPVIVVVPSRSLRLHLAGRVVAAHGAAAGVQILTLHALAHQILAAAGEPERLGAPLFPLLVRRAARREPALASFLEPLADGYAGIVATVRDLLDAGLKASHAEALDQRLPELARGGEDAAPARARAIVRVACAVYEELDRLGAGRPSALLKRAADLVLEDAERVLPARAVLVHGFAEATGLATDLIEALVRRCAARVFIDEPPDPADPAAAGPRWEFTRRLRERLAGYVPLLDRGAPGEPGAAAAAPALRRAPGAFAEVRAVAADIRALLDAGVAPESIGVVARSLGSVQHALHQHFGRLAIPYSTLGAPGLRGPESRRLESLAALLAGGGKAPVDAWLDIAYGAEGAHVSDLRLALRVLGAGTVADVAALRVAERLGGESWLALPVRRGLATAEETGEAGEEAGDASDNGEGERAGRGRKPSRRGVHADRLARAAERAGGWCRSWAALPARATMREHAAAMRSVLGESLGWRLEPGGDAAFEALARLEAELPPGLVIEREEALDLLREELRDAGRASPGGAGAGVQVLGVVEARARTFAHLFVMGLNRDVFPRQVREDWLLLDRLRGALAGVLPDIPIKRTGHDEERYLFAQLLAAAPHVTLSWTECDDDGKVTPASPLVERLLAGAGATAPLLRDLYAEGGVGDRPPRPAHEHAVLAGLAGERERFAHALEVALCDAGWLPGKGTKEGRGRQACSAIAAARAAVLAELEPDRRTAEGRRRAAAPGPYFGFIGAASAGARRAGEEEPWVTTLEGIARCPWQTFLGRVLRLAPVPDAGGDVPAFSGPLLGNVVHRALERIARWAGEDAPRLLADLSAAHARPVAWPDETELAHHVAAAAEEVLREEGLALPLLVRCLAERARLYIDVARDADFTSGHPVDVAGVEIEGSTVVADAAGRPRRVWFRADRADAAGGALVLTDYKTGGGFSKATKEENKRKPLLKAIAGGQWLQAAAYAAAGGEVAAGRYLFLKPELDNGAREFLVPGDGDVLEAFRSACVALLALLDAGALFPRLLQPDGRRPNPACGNCKFPEACVIGDSGARRRLLAWAPAGGEDAAAAAAARVWRLGEAGGEGEAPA